MTIVYALGAGLLFGALLQRAEVIRFDRQIGALLLRDMTIVKFMLSAILVGAIGVTALVGAGIIEADIKPLIIGTVGVGALLFGAGWALLGYCPGTAVAAAGEGRFDALFGIGGMLLGALLHAELYPAVEASLGQLGNFGKVTLPQLTGLSPWLFVALLAALALPLFRWFERRGV